MNHPELKRPRGAWLLAALAASVLAGACATKSNTNLVNAETNLRVAESNPKVTQNAAVPLHEAQKSTAEARAAFENGDEEDRVDHLSYLASRRTEIAVATAERNAAQLKIDDLSKQRAGVVLDARTEEARIARENAAIAQDQAALAKDQAQASALTAAALAAELSALNAKQTERGIVLTLGDVLFDVDRSELKPAAMADLKRLGELLATEPDRAVLIEGHTDSTGAAEYNNQLSQQRADSVASVLMREGISPSRLKTRGFGQTSPIATNATSAGRQQNRRVEIVVLDAKSPSISQGSR
jgi:outer membrane protein OmpA-like peptidoglycan-associated protein